MIHKVKINVNTEKIITKNLGYEQVRYNVYSACNLAKSEL